MPFKFDGRLRSLALSLCLVNSVLAQSQSASSGSGASQSSAESDMRAVAEKYFASYGAKDLDGLMSLWSGKSPDYASLKQNLQRQFSTEDSSFRDLVFSRVSVEGERASLRTIATRTSANLKGDRKREQRIARNFAFVREGGQWRVWRCAPAEDDLAEALAGAKTESERERLLNEEKDLGPSEIATALSRLGDRLYAQGNFSQALVVYSQKRSVAERAGDRRGLASALDQIGSAHHAMGDYALALEFYEKSLEIREALGDKAGVAATQNSIGRIYSILGAYTRALERYQKSLEISQALGIKAKIANALNNIGVVHRLQGDYAQALEFYRKSLAIKEELGDKAAIASTLNNLGTVYRRQGQYALAVEHFQKSLALCEAIGYKPGVAMTLNNIGFVHLIRGEYAEAEARLQKSLAVGEAIGDKSGIATTLGNLGKVSLKQGRYDQALEFAERAAALARQIGETEAVWKVRLTAGAAYLALNQPSRAQQAFEESIDAVESLRAQIAGGEQEQQRFFESRVSPYHAMVELLVARGEAAAALTFAERAKARALLDVLQQGRVSVQKTMTEEEREQERLLKSELTRINLRLASASQSNGSGAPDADRLREYGAQLGKARLNYQAFQTSLYARRPELRAQRGEAPVISAPEIAALLPDATTALLEYVVTDGKIYLFVATKAAGQPEAAIQVYTLPIERKDFSGQIEAFRGQLAGRDLGFRASAAKLYDLLLKPAAAQLRGKTNLIIAPDDTLWDLPFQALRTDADRFLIEDAAVAYAPSLTVLREMTKRRKNQEANPPPANLLALGNPQLGGAPVNRAPSAGRSGRRDEKHESLPEAEQEVRALGRLYGAARSKVYVGLEAREDRAKAEMAQAGVLHFATHGILNDATPMYSHIALARGDRNEDGMLEAWELMELDLKADLAVLSGCETARGLASAGEGMIGLSWALFVAGVPSTVVSQWKVESASTRDLMLGFHRRLRAPAAPGGARAAKAEALRQAALRLLKNPETSHPFYWAGFVLVGDGR
jgi:CHAT domain-containing protein/Tfp pilus assembly protein PilF